MQYSENKRFGSYICFIEMYHSFIKLVKNFNLEQFELSGLI
jgi:hypothetical protein